jgi:ribosome maturation factor RimP
MDEKKGDDSPPILYKYMITKEQIAQTVTHFLEGSNSFLVAVKVSASNRIEVTVDSMRGVDLDQCAAISRAIETTLNREEEDFELTVSSAGLDQPLRVFQQYLKYVGKEVEVWWYSGKKQLAVLLKATPEKLNLQYETMQAEEGKKRKKKTRMTEEFRMEEIKSIKPYIDFK